MSNRKNYTEREKCLLLSIVEKFKTIIENKCTNAVSTAQKNEAWEKIMTQFNACAENPRTSKQLNTAYLNLKRVTRRNVADENMQKYLLTKNKDVLKQLKKDEATNKKAILGTGGGPSYQPLLTAVGSQMLGLIGNQVKPLSNSCDSASTYYACVTPEDEIEVEVTDDVIHSLEDELMEEQHQSTLSDRCQSTKPATTSAAQSKIGKKATVTKGAQLEKNLGSEGLKIMYYKKKIESAMVEKITKFVMYKNELKKQTIIDLDLKIKQKEYDNLLKNSN